MKIIIKSLQNNLVDITSHKDMGCRNYKSRSITVAFIAISNGITMEASIELPPRTPCTEDNIRQIILNNFK